MSKKGKGGRHTPSSPVFLLAGLLALGLACARPAVVPESPDALEPWKRLASELRGLSFLEPVRFERIPSEAIPEIARAEIEGMFDPEYVDAYRDAYAALGLLPSNLDLMETILALQEEQLVGLYSLSRRTLYVVVDWQGEAVPPMIIVHELVHALQHQHFPLTVAILQGIQHNDDVISALSAVVEGDATITMLGVEPGFSAGERSLGQAERYRDIMLADLDAPVGLLGQAPRLLQVSLIAPYAYGIVLAAARFEAEENAGLDELMIRPPLSTLQVLFPEETDPVEFVELPLAWLESELQSLGCEIGHDNVAGFLTLQVLFEEFAPGLQPDSWLHAWRGDRFLHLQCAQGSRVIWLLRWADEEAAMEFAKAYREVAPAVAERAGLPGVPQVVLEGRTALALSPGLRPLAHELLERAEVRAYSSFPEWVAEGCFPEVACPEEESSSARRASFDARAEASARGVSGLGGTSPHAGSSPNPAAQPSLSFEITPP